MTRICPLVLLAVCAVVSPAAACETGKGTILAISSAGNALLDVRLPTEGKEESVCLQLIPHCSWSGKPTHDLLDWIQSAMTSDESCDPKFYLKNDVDYARRLTCQPAAPVARPFVFGSQVLASVGNNRCESPAVLSTTSEAVHVQAKLKNYDTEYCFELEWWFRSRKLRLAFSSSCDPFKAREGLPVSPVSVLVINPKVSVTFDVKTSEGGGWTLESVSPQPSTPYLSRWANAVRGLDVGRLTPPEDGRSRSAGSNTVQLFDLIGHWTLAMLYAGHNTDEDLAVRAWMGELELRNYDKAKNTLLRTECIEPTDVASCH